MNQTNFDANHASQPIAVVGLACRFPDARTIDGFWTNLHDGVESVSTFDRETLRLSGVPVSMLDDPSYIPKACVIDAIDRFDAGFFGFSPQEAALLDPQHRIFLECVWEALETAGHPPGNGDARTGVYAGARLSTYLYGLSSTPYVNAGTARHFMELIGNDKDYLASRVSYKLNLKGPSITVQTACSTSLVAVHLACDSLRNGETDMAVAGGSAILVPQRIGFLHHDGMILSPDGCCRPFDAKANGTTFGNGAGAVVLKRLDDALADGDTIWAVIKGSAVNNDGSRKAGYTAPGMEGQMAVIREALKRSAVHPDTISFLEAHGTGTPLGDPVEIEAATRVYREFTDKKQYCRLGAVKANIGHLDAAAGVASLIKTVLALRHGTIPPHPTFASPNPAIDFTRTPFQINTAPLAWPRNGTPRRAGVSSFGIGGTNVHLIVEEAPQPQATAGPTPSGDVFVLSARSTGALAELAQRHAVALGNDNGHALADICFTSRQGRAHFPHRLALRADSATDLRDKLHSLAEAGFPEDKPKSYRPVFLFTGQGSQYAGMGHTLYAQFPEFRHHLDTCASLLAPVLDIPLTELLFAPGEGPRLNQTVYTQPALFALEYALARCWMEWGVRPVAVLGHSLGEYVAACLAGVFSLETAIRLVAKRAELMHHLPADGAMAAVFADEATVQTLLSDQASDLAIAAVNAPTSVVVSGPAPAMRTLEARLDRQGLAWRPLAVSQGFHSRCMDPMLDAFENLLAGVTLHKPTLPIISNLTGTFVDAQAMTSPEYWRRHLRETVRFASAVETLIQAGLTDMLEIGPHPVLGQLAGQAAQGQRLRIMASMRRNTPEDGLVFEALANAYAAGADIRWKAVGGLPRARRVPLPTYPFAQERHWAADVTPSRRSVPAKTEATAPIFRSAWQAASMPDTKVPSPEAWFLERTGNHDAEPWDILPLPEAGFPDDTAGIIVRLDSERTKQRDQWSAPDARILYALTKRLRHLAATAPAQSRLVCVTRNAMAWEQDISDPEQAALWAIVQTIAREYPGRDLRLIDLAAQVDATTAAVLPRLLCSDALPSRCLLRRQGLFTPTLDPMSPAGNTSLPIREDAAYLITGATGDLGLALAQWLVLSGARHLVLVSRNAPAAGPRAVMDALAALGVAIRHEACDVADAVAVRGLFARLREDGPAVRGVFHLAATTGDTTAAQFARTISAKAAAAGHLHAEAGSLDLFVLFSSIAALHGAPGHAAYAAANAGLDALATFRRAHGLPVLCVNWGAWDAGMTARAGVREALEAEGMRAMPPSAALATLARLLETEIAQAVVMDVDAAVYQGTSSENAAHREQEPQVLAETTAKASRILNDRQALEGFLAEQIRTALKLPEGAPSPDEDLIALGLDSLMFLTLSQALSRTLGVRVGPGELFANPTVGQLAERIAGLAVSAGKTAPRRQQPEAGGSPNAPFDLTDIQYAYWIGRTDALELGRVACHTYFELDIPDLDLKRLTRVWNRIIARHAMLRCFFLAEGQQQILDVVPPYVIEKEDVSALAPAETQAALLRVRDAMSHLVHDAWKWPLFEIRASQHTARITRVHVSFDLLIADFHSITILMRELKTFYEDETAELPPLNFTFKDYIRCEAEARRQPSFEAARQYWNARLDTLPPAPPLPLARRLANIAEPRFSRCSASLPRAHWETLKRKAAAKGLTPSCLLLAVYAEVLAAWSGASRFCINLTLFNRRDHHPEVNNIVGDFTSITLLAVERPGQSDFLRRARILQDQFWKDMDYREYSGVRVIRDLNAKGGDGPGATMPVIFTANISSGSANQLDSLMGELVHSESQTPQVWLDHQVFEQNGALTILWDHVSALFPKGMIQAMFTANYALLEKLALSDATWNESTPCRLPEEQQRVRAQANATDGPRATVPLHAPFLQQVRRHGSRLAVAQNRTFFTYEGLANRIAHLSGALAQQGIGHGDIVAVSMHKGWEQVVAVFGILFAGAAFVPISPALPEARRHDMAEQADVRAIVTQKSLAGLSWPASSRIFVVDNTPLQSRMALPEPANHPDDLAYVIFTSGSTGRPKGVMISHRGAANTVLDINARFKVHEKDSLLALADLSFDLAVYDIFGPLSAGAAVVMPDADGVRDPEHWRDIMLRAGTTIWNSAPALMRMLVEYAEAEEKRLPPTLRLALLSGDWIPTDLPRRIRAVAANCQVISLGGATEASIWSILHPVADEDAGRPSIPYGRPMRNQRFHVLDSHGNDCPDWVPGSLYIEGDGLADGYLGDPGKTTECFVHHPTTGARLYKTGDLGRYMDDGCLEFLGREDFQVKIRGHRIEPGEIEAALNTHPRVSCSVVLPVGQGSDDLRLAAYVQTELDGQGLADTLTAHLAARLPASMLPSVFVGLAAMPVTENGKIDRRALPEPPQPHDTAPATEEVAPRSATERTLAGLWEELLGCRGVSVHKDFFTIGGNSLLAARLVLRIRKAFTCNLPLASLFAKPTIAGLAALLDDDAVQKAAPAVETVHTSDLDKLARLPEDIVPTETAAGNGNAILLTGATGFLGGAMLDALLTTSQSRIVCLVRSRNADDGKARLLAMLEQRGTPFAGDRERIEVVAGDLEQPAFGLAPETFADLARRVGRIIHCGARVQYAYPYRHLAAANVGGTTEALRLACLAGKDTRVLYVSTSAVIAPAGATGRIVDEQTPLAYDGEVPGGYAQTKWVAERLVRQAGTRGLPVTVVRPGTLWGDSRTGYCNSEDFPSRLAEACLELGCAPALDAQVSILPVDIAARAALALFERDDAPGATWNLLNPEMADFGQWVDAAAATAPIEKLPYEAWRDKLAEACTASPENRLTPLLPMMPATADRLQRPTAWDLGRLAKALAAARIPMPRPGAAWVGRCLEHLRKAVHTTQQGA